MNDLSGTLGLWDLALALVLVAMGLAISRWRGAGLERDMAVATVRSFAQLLAVGYVLEYAFGRGRAWLTPLVLAVMIGVAVATSSARGRQVPRAPVVAAVALTLTMTATLGLLLTLGIIPPEPRATIPLGSMVLSNAMNTTSLVMTGLVSQLAASRSRIEARLSLGLDSRQAAGPWCRQALRAGMLPIVDNTKVVGLVALPGAMTGMLLAGASPTDAIRLQLVVMYMLLGGNAFAALAAGEGTLRTVFTRDHQLVALDTET